MKKIVLLNLSIRNFKGIRSLDINFNEDITDIFGRNGSGKTTVADAIYWILFDKDSQDRKEFDIKTLNSNGVAIPKIDHVVSASFAVNDVKLILTKTYREKWSKKTGEAEKRFTGHETIYEINNVPVKKKEYTDKTNSLVKEDLFKLLTNSNYFATKLKDAERRKLLLDVCGEITNEAVLESSKDLKGVEELLEQNPDLDELKKQFAASRKKSNDKLKDIPAKITELENLKVFENFAEVEKQLEAKEKELKIVESSLESNTTADEEKLNISKQMLKLESELSAVEYKEKAEAEKPRQELKNKLYEAETDYKYTKLQKSNLVKEQLEIKKNMEKLQNIIKDLRAQYLEISKEKLIFKEDQFVCPTCKRPLEENDIENRKAELLENFNEEKSKKIEANKAKGFSTKEEIKKNEEKFNKNNAELKELEEKEFTQSTLIKDLQNKINNFQIIQCDSPEKKRLIEEIQILKAKRDNIKTPDRTAATLEKEKIKQEIKELNQKLFQKQNNENLQNRIKELLLEERKLNVTVADLERKENLIDKFVRVKMEMLEKTINNRFKNIKFRLFKQLTNGGFEKTCDPLINGVPFESANNAAKVNAGLEIINELSSYYELSLPVVLDNRESVTEIIETRGQVINLFVDSRYKELTIGNTEQLDENELPEGYFACDGSTADNEVFE